MTSKFRGLRNGMRSLWLSALLAVFAIPAARASPSAQSNLDGEAIFKTNCASCHTIWGGKLVGPDLAGVSQKRDRQWLIDFIASPDKVLAANDPIANSLLLEFNNIPMPNQNLSQDEVLAVIGYLEAQEKAMGAASPGEVSKERLPSGDPDQGEALFMGEVHFLNDGPPCMGCHNIDSFGILGGGTLGPDLTQTFVKYGDAGLASVLANISFPTMKPIYNDHPLTVEEQADLYAFIQAAASQPQSDKEIIVLALSLAGVLAAMFLVGFVWRGRLKGVRSQLLEQTQVKK